jgi:hypothetical protein
MDYGPQTIIALEAVLAGVSLHHCINYLFSTGSFKEILSFLC